MPGTASAIEPHVFERGDKLYIVSPVAPFEPGESDIDEFAFAEELRKMAPNDHLLWLRGNYVEADNPNANGQMWTAGEIALKSLTPMFMPVTVMHDPRTAVGLIADVALKTPDKDKIPRSRIDTSLALWQHRFPEVAEETLINYKAGSLMQSMECVSPHYSCAECGQMFHKLPDRAERKNWCSHLSESDGFSARKLEGVVFTGTGLIFGTRGAKGANDRAHLEVFEEEVAEFHEKSHRDKKPKKKTSQPPEQRKGLKNVETVEISKNEYDRLQEAEREAKSIREELEKAKADRDEAVKATEEAEAKQKEAEEAKATAEKKVQDFEEKANQQQMAGERMEKLGSKFLDNLGKFTRKRLEDQAADLKDEEWEDRLKELEEQSKLKRDAKKDGEDEETSAEEEEGVIPKEETASAQLNGGRSNGAAPAKGQLRSVVAGLISPAEKTE